MRGTATEAGGGVRATRRTWGWSLAVLFLALSLPGPAGAATTRPALAGTVVLRGSRTASVAVRLTRAVRIGDPATNPAYRGDVAVAGESRFAGFLLLADVPGLSGIGVVGGAMPADAGGTIVHPTSGLDPQATEWTLPAGNYRLYLLAHGKPVTVRFRLRGLTGTSTLAPNRAVGSTLAVPAPTVSTAPAGLVYSAGADVDLRGPALYLSFAYLRHDTPHVASQYGGCEYYSPPDTGPLAYAPGCPSPLDDRGQPVLVYTAEAPDLKFVVIAGTPAGTWRGGAGASWTTATPPVAVGYFHFWMAL